MRIMLWRMKFDLNCDLISFPTQLTIWGVYFELNYFWAIKSFPFTFSTLSYTILIHSPPARHFASWSFLRSILPLQTRIDLAVLSTIGFWFLLQKVNDVGINHVWEGVVQYNDGLIPRCNNKAFCKIAVFYVIVANPLPAYKLVP